MFTRIIPNEDNSKVARITANDSQGPFSTRLYVNGGETATQVVRKAKTFNGAMKQADKMICA